MKKLLVLLGLSLILGGCAKNKAEIESTQNVVVDKPNGGLTEEQRKNYEWARDLDKKQNFSGKVLALSYLENHKVKVKMLSLTSPLVQGMVFSNELIVLNQNASKKLSYIEIESKDKKLQKTLRVLFDWNKKTNKCVLRSQFYAKDITVTKDPYPLTVNKRYCDKFYKNG